MNPLVIMKVQQLRSFTDYYDKKRTSKLVDEIQALSDKDMGVSEFFIRQVEHKNICYFSYKMRKDQFLSQAMKDKWKDHTEKLLNKLKHLLQPNMLWFFSYEKNSTRIRW